MSVVMPDCSECSIIKPSHHIPHLHALADAASRDMVCICQIVQIICIETEWTLMGMCYDRCHYLACSSY